MKPILIAAFCAIVLVMSVIAFILYAVDKAKAKKGAWRIPEAVLLGWGFFGGAIGALVAMKNLRHKTKHWYFWAVNILGLLWQVALVVVMIIVL
ncbi:MAG: DUF1294 domain-containing protein [Clostridia bacterium]|nr:DUF1294 domain-containing protein [Clostridia bacterium]MBQ8861137.1 DUF1294 domain-containing protein [Clostridia bacterium]